RAGRGSARGRATRAHASATSDARRPEREGCRWPLSRYPAMTFFISPSAHAMASLVDVPVTALASMLGRMNELVMSWTLSLGGAGQPYVWYCAPSFLRFTYFGSVFSTGWSCMLA